MTSGELDRERLRKVVIDTILRPDFRRATFGGAARREAPAAWIRVAVRPVELQGERHLQFSYFDAKKDTTKNFRGRAIVSKLDEVLAIGFARVNLATHDEETDIRTTKKGKVLISRRKVESQDSETLLAHNRIKDVPLPEGQANRLLEVMGILTRDGRVRPTMRAKYTQINEFLKHLTHVLDDAGLRSLGRAIEILDCGCGSSFLTLAAHHYLNEVLGIPAHVMGVDVNEEVIRKSVARSQRLGAERPTFACGPISAGAEKPDIVMALHACDTATDDAMARAVMGEAKLLLSVPCCHHHLNSLLRSDGPAHVMRPLLRHGILQQRTADLVTDAFRAVALRIMGYRTEVIEFICTDHTARNLMIRAVGGAKKSEAAFVNEYQQLRHFWGVTPYIEEALGEPFQRLLQAPG